MSCPACGKREGHWSNCPRPERFVWNEDEDVTPVIRDLPEQGQSVIVPDGREGTVFSASPGLPHSGTAPWAFVDFGPGTDLEAHDVADLRAR